jgi:hypothetical protein
MKPPSDGRRILVHSMGVAKAIGKRVRDESIFAEFAVYFVKRGIITSMAFSAPQNTAAPTDGDDLPDGDVYPTPPPFSSYADENNNVTSKKHKMTPENKQLTPRNPWDHRPRRPTAVPIASEGL